MFVGKDWNKGIRQAQANANWTGEPWVVWLWLTDVHCERAEPQDLTGESRRMKEGALVVEPELKE